MLAFATKGTTTGDKNHIASLDFAVSATGKIAQVPDLLLLEIVQPDGNAQQPVNNQLDAVISAEEQVRVLGEAVVKAKTQEQKRENDWKTLVDEGANAQVMAYASINFTGIQRAFSKGDVPFPALFSDKSEYFIYAADDLTKTAVEELSKPNSSAIIVRLASTQAPEIGRSNASTWIRRDVPGFFKGIISEVRIWNTGLETDDLGREISGGESGGQ
ncbi:MAG: hypothetical protein ACKVU2_02465 [Saprospiraceae bacterium]